MTVQSQRARWNDPLGIDYVLLGIVALLVVLGLIMVWSVTFVTNVGEGVADPQADFVKQSSVAIAGIIIALILSRIDYRIWGRIAVPMMMITVALLILVLFTTPVNGARRWLLGNWLQPSEVAKFTLIVYMAKWASSKGEKLKQLTYGVLPFGIIVGGVCGLIILEPNMSTALIIGMCALAMFFIAGADVIQLLLLGIIGGVATIFVVVNTPYQLARWVTFVQDPFAMTGREGYQIAETLIALGSGGMFGRGIGSGYAKFGYVPAPQTDTIFALLGEEIGLVGTWAVLALYLLLVYRGFRIASRAKDPFGQVFAAGLSFWLIFQAFANIAVITATIPFTGVPLPFISFGGSALLSALVAVGVLLSISRNETAPKESHATFNFGWRDGGARVSSPSRRRRNVQVSRPASRTRNRAG